MTWRSGQVGDVEAAQLAAAVDESSSGARARAGLSRRDLATRSDVSADTTAGYETGRQRATVATLTKLAVTLYPDLAEMYAVHIKPEGTPLRCEPKDFGCDSSTHETAPHTVRALVLSQGIRRLSLW